MEIILLLVLDIVASSVIMIVIVCGGGGVSGNKAHNKKTLWATLCLFRLLYIALLSFIIPQRIVYLYDCNIPSYYWILSQPTYFSYKNN